MLRRGGEGPNEAANTQGKSHWKYCEREREREREMRFVLLDMAFVSTLSLERVLLLRLFFVLRSQFNFLHLFYICKQINFVHPILSSF